MIPSFSAQLTFTVDRFFEAFVLGLDFAFAFVVVLGLDFGVVLGLDFGVVLGPALGVVLGLDLGFDLGGIWLKGNKKLTRSSAASWAWCLGPAARVEVVSLR